MAALTPEERAEVDARSAQITFYERTALLLRSERALFWRHLLTAKGLDPAKQYNVSPEGELTEVPDA
jgi:hypothetical protein